MADKTGIEWTDATWNPIRGCSRVSDGCRHCYAETQAARIIAMDRGRGVPEGQGSYDGLLAKGGQWNGQITFVPELLSQPVRWQRPRRIFVNSMSDLFHENVPEEVIQKIFAIMAVATQHTFQILTKRPERMAEVLGNKDLRWIAEAVGELTEAGIIPAGAHSLTWPLPNVWLGISVEDQATADSRIPALLDTPAHRRWLSMEPLLGPVDLSEWISPTLHCSACGGSYGVKNAIPDPDGHPMGKDECAECGAPNCMTTTWGEKAEAEGCPDDVEPEEWNGGLGIDWVVVGGESGEKARPMHPRWATDLRDQCREAGVPFLFKQWGEWAPRSRCYHTLSNGKVASEIDPGSTRWPTIRLTFAGNNGWDLAHAGEGDEVYMQRVGKRLAGRELLGELHDGYPR